MGRMAAKGTARIRLRGATRRPDRPGRRLPRFRLCPRPRIGKGDYVRPRGRRHARRCFHNLVRPPRTQAAVDSPVVHEPHEAFEAPSTPDIPIWRYMNLAKFMSVLQDEALHFARADQMTDEFEGSISKPTFSIRRASLTGIPDIDPESLSAQLGHSRKRFQQFVYLNCWHMNEIESAAMWDLYLGGEPEGVAC